MYKIANSLGNIAKTTKCIDATKIFNGAVVAREEYADSTIFLVTFPAVLGVIDSEDPSPPLLSSRALSAHACILLRVASASQSPIVFLA
jgi:hypothetical protein